MQVGMVETREQVVFDLMIQSIRQQVPQPTLRGKVVGGFDLCCRPGVNDSRISLLQFSLAGLHICFQGGFVQVIDLRKDGEENT